MKNRFLLFLLLFGTLFAYAGNNRDGLTPYWNNGGLLPGYTGGGNMTLAAAIHIDGQPITNPNYELAPFQVTDEGLVLSAQLGKFPVVSGGEYIVGPTGAYVYGLVPFGYEDEDESPDGNRLSFKIYDHETNQILDLLSPTIIYHDKWSPAEYEHPLVLNFYTSEPKWELVEDASSLKDGDVLLIVAADDDYAMNEDQGKNDRGAWPISYTTDGSITWDEPNPDPDEGEYGPQEIVLYQQVTPGSQDWGLFAGRGYLYAASNSKDYLRSQNNITENSRWSIEIEDGVATITSLGSYSHNILTYDDEAFVCAVEEIGAVKLYRKVVGGTQPVPQTYQVSASVSPSTAGSVLLNGEAFQNGTFTEGTSITLTQSAAEGYVFSHWVVNNDNVQDEQLQLTVNDNYVITAVFTPLYSVSVTIEPEGAGLVNYESGEAFVNGSFEEGSSISLVAQANSGYVFLNWLVNDQYTEAAQLGLTVNQDYTVVAHFLAVYTLSLSVDPEGAGTVAQELVQGTEDNGMYYSGSMVKVTATAADDTWAFDGWKNGTEFVSTDLEYSFMIGANTTLVAVFHKKTQEVAVEVVPEGAGTIYCNGTALENGAYNYDQGSTLSFEVVANDGYVFSQWTVNQSPAGNETTMQMEVPAYSTIITAVFTPVYPLTVEVVPEGAATYTIEVPEGAIVDGNNYGEGTEITVTAAVNPGFNFLGWMMNGNVVTNELSYTFAMAAAITMTATCEAIEPHSVTLEVGSGQALDENVLEESVGGAGVVLPAAQPCDAAITAGYTFAGWALAEVAETNEAPELFLAGSTYKPTEDQVLYAVYHQMGELVNAGWPAAGDVVYMVNTTGKFELAGLSTTNNPYGIGQAYEDAPAGIFPLTVANGIEENTLSFIMPDGTYLGYNAGSNSNSLRAELNQDITSSWNVMLNNDLTHTISNAAETTRVILWNVGSPRFAAYAGKEVGANYHATTFFKEDGNGVYNTNPSCEGPVVTQNPVFENVPATILTPTVMVEISCPTNGANIYYTTDGTEPTTESTLYEGPFPITETTTVKAMALVEGGEPSGVVEQTYTFPRFFQNIAEFKEAYTATSSEVCVILSDITFVHRGGAYMFVQDATAALLIYDNNNIITTEYENGDVISGGVAGTFTLYKNQIELVPVANTAEGVAGTAVEPQEVTAADVLAAYGDYDAKLVKMTEVTFTADYTFVTNGSTTFTQGEATYTVFNRFGTLDLTVAAEQEADVIGFIGVYNTTNQIYPRDNEDIIFAEVPVLKYNITVAANPTEGGTVSGGGEYDAGQTVTVTATANENYTFQNWTVNGNMVSEEANYSFPAEEDVDLVANFLYEEPVVVKYNVTVAANPTEGGTVSGGGEYDPGQTVTVTATANENYTFQNWTVNGNMVSEEAEYSFPAEEDVDLVANFLYEEPVIVKYNVTVAANPTEGGTVSGGGEYDPGQTVTVTATANENYTFQNWTVNGNMVSEEATYSFPAEEDVDLVANFLYEEPVIKYNITVTANPVDGGIVTGGGEYVAGETVNVTATPAEGYVFVVWKQDGTEVSDQATYSFPAAADVDLVAEFAAEVNLDLELNIEGSGNVFVNAEPPYYYNQYLTLNAVAEEGYEFDYFEITTNRAEVIQVYENPYSFHIKSDVFVEVFFKSIVPETPKFNVTAICDPTEAGAVIGAGSYDEGSNVELEATANPGWDFDHWEVNGEEVAGEVSGTGTYLLTLNAIDADKDVVAFFIPGEAPSELFTVEIEVLPRDAGTFTGAGSNYGYGAIATLTAIPNTEEGYYFVEWRNRYQTPLSSENPYRVTVTNNVKYYAYFERNSYNIAAVASPTTGGEIFGTGMYQHGAHATLNAQAAEGYTFVNWTEGTEVVCTEEEYEFTVTGARNLVANFQLNSYAVNAVADPIDFGTVEGSGDYGHGTTAELTAIPNEGYHIVNWTDNGVEVAADVETYSFVVTEAHENIVAHFAINTYTVTVEALGNGTVSGGNTVNHGESITLNAAPAEGYHFDGWFEGETLVSADAEYTFVVTADHNFVGHFTINSYAVAVTPNPETAGTVAGGGNFEHGATANLTATPNEGYHIVNWTDDHGEGAADVDNYSFVVTEDHNIVVNFEINTYVVTLTAQEGGSVEGDGTYEYNQLVTVNAIVNEGYDFVGWYENEVKVSDDAEFSFNITANRDLVAHFQIKSYTVTAIALADDNTDCGVVNGSGSYEHGETAVLTAIVNPGYELVNWTDNDVEVVAGVNTYSFTVTEAHENIVVHCNHIQYNLTVGVNNAEYGTATMSDAPYYYGEEVELTATPITGHVFMNWTKNGAVVSDQAHVFLTIDGDADYVAVFALEGYAVNVTVDPEEGGTVVVTTDAYEFGSTITLTETPNAGYDFAGWTINDVDYGTDPTVSFTLTGATQVVASFVLHEYSITVDVNDDVMGTAEVVTETPYYYNNEVLVKATAIYGYHFENWTVDGVVVSNDEEYTFVVTGDRHLTANFAVTMYNIAASAMPTVGGYVEGAGSYAEGTTITLNAVPNEHYYFVNWTENGEVVYEEAEWELFVDASRTLVANFAPITFDIEVAAVPRDYGTVTGGGTYNEGQTITVTAAPKPGYRFVNWTEYDIEQSTNLSYSFVVDRSRSLIAHFEQIPGVQYYEINAVANPEEGGTIQGAGEYAEGTTVVLKAIPNDGYRFLNWTENGEIVYVNAQWTFTANASRDLVANFEEIPVEYTITIADVENGVIEAPASSIAGETITVIVSSEPMYRLAALYYYAEGSEEMVNINLQTKQFIMPAANITLGAEFMYVEGKGDVNLDGEVNIIDVLTTINYILGDDPQPFDLEQADMDEDGEIQLNDAVAINALILGLRGNCDDYEVTYQIVDGQLFIESDLALAGYQLTLSAEPASINIDGFTTMGRWNNGEYTLLIFNLNSEKEAGLYSVIDMGDATLNNIVMSTKLGCKVRGIDGIVSVASFDEQNYSVFPVPANTEVTVAGPEITTIEVFNMMGQKVMTVSTYSDETVVNVSSLSVGNYLFRINTANGVTTKNVVVVR